MEADDEDDIAIALANGDSLRTHTLFSLASPADFFALELC